MPDGSEPTPVQDVESLARLFGADRETHIYGLADLDEPFRSHTKWFQVDDAVVGIISTGDDWVAGYAMSQINPERTLDLLMRIQDRLPPATWITGPIGLHETVTASRTARPVGRHWRMILRDFQGSPADEATTLAPADADALVDLYDSDPGAAFFMPSMLDHGHFVGIAEDGALVAAAGTHVANEKRGVVALGAILTRPDRRGRGLGLAVTGALCDLLVNRYRTVGLNVKGSNTTGIRLYESLGFTKRFEYEEVELA